MLLSLRVQCSAVLATLIIGNNCFSSEYHCTQFGRIGRNCTYSNVIVNGVTISDGTISNGRAIVPPEEMTTQLFTYDTIRKLKLPSVGNSVGNVEIYQQESTEKDSLVVDADESIMPYIRPSYDASKQTLTLGLLKQCMTTIIYTLKAKDLNGIKISGKGNVNFRGNVHPSQLQVKISGNGNCFAESIVSTLLNLKIFGKGEFNFKSLSCDELKSSISGKGKLVAHGNATKQKYSISGKGKIDASQLTGDTGEVSISGSGKADVNIERTLKVIAPSERCVNNFGSGKTTFEQASSDGCMGNISNTTVVGCRIIGRQVSNGDCKNQ